MLNTDVNSEILHLHSLLFGCCFNQIYSLNNKGKLKVCVTNITWSGHVEMLLVINCLVSATNLFVKLTNHLVILTSM